MMYMTRFPELTKADMDAFEQFCRDGNYLESIWTDMLREHPDCYVTVYQEQVVAVHQTIEGAFAEVDEKDVPRCYTVIKFVTDKPLTMIL